MKRTLTTIFFSLCLVLPFTTARAAPPQDVAVGVGVGFGHAGFFYDDLRPYGEWIMLDDGFYAWRPMDVRPGWRPYVHGRWIWTDHGWYWVSSEPFGWIVFHYGRWYYDDFHGWIWIPDDVWGPGWVEWRYQDSHIGWAPLPPYASFSVAVGIRFTRAWVAPWSYWTFVRYRHFASNDVGRYCVNENYTRRLIRSTRPAVRYDVEGDRIINRGLGRRTIESRGRIRVGVADVANSNDRSERYVRGSGRQRIEVYRPTPSDLERRPDRIDARQPERRSTLDLNAVERPGSRENVGRPKERTAPRGDQNREQPPTNEVSPTPPSDRPRQPETAEPRQRETWRVRPEQSQPAAPRETPRAQPDQTRPPREASPAPSGRASTERATTPTQERRETPTVRPQPRKEQARPQQSTKRSSERPRPR